MDHFSISIKKQLHHHFPSSSPPSSTYFMTRHSGKVSPHLIQMQRVKTRQNRIRTRRSCRVPHPSALFADGWETTNLNQPPCIRERPLDNLRPDFQACRKAP